MTDCAFSTLLFAGLFRSCAMNSVMKRPPLGNNLLLVPRVGAREFAQRYSGSEFQVDL